MTDRQQPPDHRPIFTLRIVGKPGSAGTRAMRFLLKRLLRQYNFTCLDIREEPAPAREVSNQAAPDDSGRP
jgi:hypothetical protein